MPTLAKLGVLVATLGFCASAAAAGNLYCCHDAAGKQVCGDLLPHACYGRAYREIGSTGHTVRTVEAPLTAEQRVEREEEEAQLKIEEAAKREQRRKDQALLNTYSSEKEIELLRSRAKGDVQKAIAVAEAKIGEIRVRRKKYEDEAEFYKKTEMPAEVRKGLLDTDFEIKAQELVIESKTKELEIIREKYDEDLNRFRDIMTARKRSRR